MTHTKRWSVDIFIDEHPEDRSTRAEARLRSDAGTQLRGTGVALRSPRDFEVPEIGDEVAVARALADLAAKVQAAATVDVAAMADDASHGW